MLFFVKTGTFDFSLKQNNTLPGFTPFSKSDSQLNKNTAKNCVYALLVILQISIQFKVELYLSKMKYVYFVSIV